jgi:hypothetical protein
MKIVRPSFQICHFPLYPFIMQIILTHFFKAGNTESNYHKGSNSLIFSILII